MYSKWAIENSPFQAYASALEFSPAPQPDKRLAEAQHNPIFWRFVAVGRCVYEMRINWINCVYLLGVLGVFMYWWRIELLEPCGSGCHCCHIIAINIVDNRDVSKSSLVFRHEFISARVLFRHSTQVVTFLFANMPGKTTTPSFSKLGKSMVFPSLSQVPKLQVWSLDLDIRYRIIVAQ